MQTKTYPSRHIVLTIYWPTLKMYGWQYHIKNDKNDPDGVKAIFVNEKYLYKNWCLSEELRFTHTKIFEGMEHIKTDIQKNGKMWKLYLKAVINKLKLLGEGLVL